MLTAADLRQVVFATAVAVAITYLLRYSPQLYAKGRTYVFALIYMALSRDTQIKVPKPTDPPLRGKESSITIIFVRHGESTWNEIFNKKPKVMLPFRLVMGLCRELAILSEAQDSIFLDAPLNDEGVEQAQKLGDFMTRSALAEKYSADLKNGILVSSNLRRALSTGLLAFKHRLKHSTSEKVRIWTCLQECSRNVDTQSLTPEKRFPAPSAILRRRDPEVAQWYSSHTDVDDHRGNKTLRSNGMIRMLQFCDMAFRHNRMTPPPLRSNCVVACGHSIWFRNFFRSFIRSGGDAPMARLATTKKIRNGGMVRFKLTQYQGDVTPTNYSVDSASIEEIFLGFEK